MSFVFSFYLERIWCTIMNAKSSLLYGIRSEKEIKQIFIFQPHSAQRWYVFGKLYVIGNIESKDFGRSYINKVIRTSRGPIASWINHGLKRSAGQKPIEGKYFVFRSYFTQKNIEEVRRKFYYWLSVCLSSQCQ